MGQIQIAQAVPETYRYVAGYVTKKMYEIDGVKANAYYELGQQKPFACMSLKPGLGDHYYQEHKAEIWKQGYIQCTNGKHARKHFEMLEKVKMYSLPCIRRILTEDSPIRAGALED